MKTILSLSILFLTGCQITLPFAKARHVDQLTRNQYETTKTVRKMVVALDETHTLPTNQSTALVMEAAANEAEARRLSKQRAGFEINTGQLGGGLLQLLLGPYAGLFTGGAGGLAGLLGLGGYMFQRRRNRQMKEGAQQLRDAEPGEASKMWSENKLWT